MIDYRPFRTGWTLWFAWYPVMISMNKWVWMKRIYRRKISKWPEGHYYDYGTLFDVLKKKP